MFRNIDRSSFENSETLQDKNLVFDTEKVGR